MMPSIDERLSRMEKQLSSIERMIRDLVRDKNLKNKEDEWISEKEAAVMLNYAPRTLKHYARSGKIPLPYQDRDGRNYQYNREYILKLKSNPVYMK